MEVAAAEGAFAAGTVVVDGLFMGGYCAEVWDGLAGE